MIGNVTSRCSCFGPIACLTMMTLVGCSGDRDAKMKTERSCMIVARLQDAEQYCDMHPAFAKAFAFLRRSDLAELPEGRQDIDGDRLFCIISKGRGRPRAEAKLEAHRKYIDIQYILSGDEEMGWRPTASCGQIDTPYDAEKDIEFFKDPPNVWAAVPPGSFTIFFPEDAHAPLVGPGQIHKAVLKIAVE